MMTLSTLLSLSSITCDWTYDVFLNWGGVVTIQNFTNDLYDSLQQNGIRTFIDDKELWSGEEIRPSLIQAIKESRIFITVFSNNYASSTYCLDELVMILECCPKSQGRLFWPVFYDLDPSQVRHQKGTYAEALAKHEERFNDDKDKVRKWRDALRQAANVSGWHFQQGSQSESKLIRKIVEEVSAKINHAPLHVANNPVGLESPVLQVTSLLGLDSEERVNMVGIYGISGIGKSTVACAVGNFIADQFECWYFLGNIRERAINRGLVQLQETLLDEIPGEKYIKVGDTYSGILIIKNRLHQKKVLLILDDVDKLEQLQVLAGRHDWFGSGSRIIITARDEDLLVTHGVEKLYEVKPLNDEKALELFSWHAFKNNKINPGYEDVSKRAIFYCHGLPLALEVIGSHLFGKSLDVWKSELEKYERVLPREIHEILTYDDLEEDDKAIFLDIACFFDSCEIGYVKEMLYSSHGFHAENSIQVLIDKSLIKIDGNGCVRMRDLIQDMGREIVRLKSTLPTLPSLSSCTRDWTYDVFLNFRGVDTRNNFTASLYNSLDQKGIHTFIDEEWLKRGEQIMPAILKAIKESKIFIAVFSKNYASSTYCLEELATILECCLKTEGRLFFPVFYDVDPSQVQHQSGTYAQALAKHVERFKDDMDKVQKWRDALRQAADASGWHFQHGSQLEREFIRKIVEEVSEKFKWTPLRVASNPVGLDSPVLEVISLLGLKSHEGVNMVGIYGMGGIGKSAVARYVHNLIADQFEGVCFLANIRERAMRHGLAQLQETLLNEILGEKDNKVGDVYGGISIIKKRLHQKKVVLILDDVYEVLAGGDDVYLGCLQVLAGGYDWFGPGSRIIITTRDKHLLANHGGVILYEVKPLNDEKALELFSRHAFESNKINPGYVDVSKRAVSYAHGLPLAMEAEV